MTHRFSLARFVRVLAAVGPSAAVASFATGAVAQQTPAKPAPVAPVAAKPAAPAAAAAPAAPAPAAPAPAPAPAATAGGSVTVAPAPAPAPATAPVVAPAPEPAPTPPPPAPPVSGRLDEPVMPSPPSAVASPPAEAPKTNPEAPLDEPVAVKGKWNPVLYGFVEFDAINDSTQSFNDAAGNAAIARPGSYGGEHARTMFGVRNSRLGFKLTAPETNSIKATGILEMDFLGNQPPTATEAAFFTNPTFRIRHFALKIENPYVDVLAGQYWQLFGWQSYFHPNTVEIQGVPGEVYSRAPQLRLSHVFKTDPVNIELAIAAARPPQRNSAVPDGQAGLRFLINGWKGIHTGGATGTAVDSLALGVSAVGRHFRVAEFAASPKASVEKNAGGISVDALIPVIPAKLDDRANGLTLNGSFVTGSGIADLYTGLTGGVGFPSLPNPMMTTPAPTYTPDVDAGLVTYDANGGLHAINWQSYMVGAQYYLPPSGKVWLSVNYSHMKSSNAADFVSDKSKVFTKSDWVDGNVFWDALPAVRVGAEYAYFHQTYGDDKTAKNHRVQLSAFYIF